MSLTCSLKNNCFQNRKEITANSTDAKKARLKWFSQPKFWANVKNC